MEFLSEEMRFTLNCWIWIIDVSQQQYYENCRNSFAFMCTDVYFCVKPQATTDFLKDVESKLGMIFGFVC